MPTNQGPLYDIREQYGLSSAAIGFDGRHANEWYFQSDNGSNPANGGYYVLFPNGLLYAWAPDPSDNLLTDTLAGTPVANLSSEGVWADPALLSNAQPVVTNDPNYAVREQFGLYTADIPHTWTYLGQYLRIFQSGNGSNSTNSGYYVMTNSGSLYTFVDNSFPLTLAGIPVATLGANVYNNPDMLYSDMGQTLAVTAAVDSSGNVTITPNVDYVGTAGVSVAVSDGAEMASQNISFTSTNALPAIPTVSLTPVAHGSGASTFNLGATDGDTNDTLSYTVQVAGYNPLYDLQVKLGLNNPDIFHTWLYQGSYIRIFQSSNGNNSANGGYYVLTPTDQLYAAVLDPNLDFSATLIAANLVADFTAAPYSPTGNVYNDPALLYDAVAPAAPTVQTNRGPLYDVQQEFGLTTPDILHSWAYQGSYLRVFQSSNGSNAVNGGYYYLMPTGMLYAWDGNSIATMLTQTPVANLSSYGVYANPSLLYNAQPAFINTGVAPAVTATVDSSGNIQLTPNIAFTGTVRIIVTAADGVAITGQSFLYTVTDGAPILPAITTSSISTTSTSAQVTLSATDSAHNTNTSDLSFAATVVTDNPLYNVKVEYGLTAPDIAAAYDKRGGNEKYFQSTDGSNLAGGGYYVLMPNNRLYAWDGVSLATTIAQTPLADLTYFGVYANTSLLYNAVQLPASSVTASFTNTSTGGTLTLSWPSGYTGTFVATVTVGDGAEETQQSFMLPNNAAVVSNTVPAQTASASSSPTQIDLAGYFADTNTTNSEVTFNITNGTVPETINVTLLDTTAPLAVTNFLDYVRAGDYSNNIFSRLYNSGIDILQGGGLLLNAAGNGLSTIPTDPDIPTVFGATNAADTLAMAMQMRP